MDFVMYKNDVHVLVSQENDKVTIAGLKMVGTYDSFYVYEIDVNERDIYTAPIVHQQSIIYRLKEYLEDHKNIFGFCEEELSKIHFF